MSRRIVSYAVASLVATFLLTACSPKLDWRTVQSPQENYTALFPGKPEKLDRKIPYQGQEIPQTLEAVKIDDDIYSVSATQLNQSQVEFLPNLLAQLQDNLFKRANVNLDNAVSKDDFYQTVSRQKIVTKDYFLEFPSTGAIETSMRVRWITRITPERGAWVYQISVLHTAPARVEAKKFFSEEAYSNFFDEFRPE
ncbi:hypothetical protein TUM22923_17010 [Polynucleobacter sp. TUM22923]|uniref:hypothetical protein n=1 Tax=Polynucleobacter sp. TUM22923 TaxID=3022126 RepID=UPI0025734B91|nr:hypothetical protein [Polynucleobacter sp. TUM22923]BDX22380.1 hypothetical protein TUM22923_17010 [Polynucleobacter sp. TUM22923]